MTATYLDDASITEILKFRPVYITTQFVRDYDNPTCDILAVQFSFESAVLKAVCTAFSELSETDYNPHFRYTSHKLSRWEMDEGLVYPQYEWRDGWTGWTSISCYRIEEWQPERGNIHRHTFRFDTWFKNKIAAEGPSCSTIKNWLSDWRLVIDSGTIPAELMARILPENVKDDLVQEIPWSDQDWVAKYGSAKYSTDPEAIPPHPDFA